jgi:hypothetical protein
VTDVSTTGTGTGTSTIATGIGRRLLEAASIQSHTGASTVLPVVLVLVPVLASTGSTGTVLDVLCRRNGADTSSLVPVLVLVLVLVLVSELVQQFRNCFRGSASPPQRL